MTSESNQNDLGLHKFTVLHHTGIEEPHFDFMFEISDRSELITFRLAQWPPRESGSVLRLRDHRRAYLSFQGAIPGDRGHVERVDEGQMRVIKHGSGWMLHHTDGRPFARLEPENEGSVDRGQQPWFLGLLDS